MISFIGVTCATSNTEHPAWRRINRRRAASTRRATWDRLSPPGAARLGCASQSASSSAQPACTAAKVSPSQAPKSHSRRSGSVSTDTPNRCATTAAVCCARRSGEATTTSTPPRAPNRSAQRRAWSSPVADSAGSDEPPLNRRCAVCSVSPCRSSSRLVVVPRSCAHPMIFGGACACCSPSSSLVPRSSQSLGSPRRRRSDRCRSRRRRRSRRRPATSGSPRPAPCRPARRWPTGRRNRSAPAGSRSTGLVRKPGSATGPARPGV